jgi:hypothetical protein
LLVSSQKIGVVGSKCAYGAFWTNRFPLFIEMLPFLDIIQGFQANVKTMLW